MKLRFLLPFVLLAACNTAQPEGLVFSTDNCRVDSIRIANGPCVKFYAYEDIYYVTEVEDSTYQKLNIYVPEGVQSDAPVFLRTYVGGFMAGPALKPWDGDATGRALAEGYVVCIPAARGFDSMMNEKSTGTAPNAILDLKAAVRYLRFNDERIPGDSRKIITDGTSAGGAMSSLLGSTANHPDYEQALKAMGAAPGSDEIYAAVCYCPIIDLEHADMAYEWLFGCTNGGVRELDSPHTDVSEALAAGYMDYVESLNLKNPQTGEILDRNNYPAYLKQFLDEALKCNVNMSELMEHVAGLTPLKTPPAFDGLGVEGNSATFENKLFGNAYGVYRNFTAFSCKYNPDSQVIDEELMQRVRMMNPMNYIRDTQSCKAKYWYIRHGVLDRDTAHSISLNLYTMLTNEGYEVNYALPEERYHEGDYDLDDLFSWIKSII